MGALGVKTGAVLVAATLAAVSAGPAAAQYAGSNLTGSKGVVAVDKQGDKIRFYDPVTLAEVKVLDVAEKTVHELTVSYDHRWAYVPIYGDGIYGQNATPNNKILVVDLERKAIDGYIDLGARRAPHGVAATRDGKLWVICDRDNSLLLIDPARKAIEASYVAPGKGGHFLSMLPDESKIYISNKEGDLAVFDVRARAFRPSVRLGRPGVTTGNGSGGESLTPTPDGRRLLIADNADNDIHVIDTADDREVAKVALQGRAPSNPKRSRLVKLRFSPDARRLVVTTFASGQAWVIDAADYSRQTMISVAKGPQGVAFAPDSRTVLVASPDDGLLTVIDLEKRQTIRAVDGGSGIEVLAYY